jgi:hypothetical protein
VLLGKRELGPSVHSRLDVEEWRQDLDRRNLPKRRSRDHAQTRARKPELWQGLGPDVLERRLHLLTFSGESDPALEAMHEPSSLSRLAARALRVDDAATRRHPVNVARTNGLIGAKAILVNDLALEQIRHGGEPDVRMRTDVQPLSRI